jgi:hypothetical protein
MARAIPGIEVFLDAFTVQFTLAIFFGP